MIKPGIYLEVWEATNYPGRPIQLSISKLDCDGAGSGYRIAGPKFTTACSRLLRKVRLDRDQANAIQSFLDQISAPVEEGKVREGKPLITGPYPMSPRGRTVDPFEESDPAPAEEGSGG